MADTPAIAPDPVPDPLAPLIALRMARPRACGLALSRMSPRLRDWLMDWGRVHPTRNAGVTVDLDWSASPFVRVYFHTPTARYARQLGLSPALTPGGQHAAFVRELARWLIPS